jgi:hypothetical protein
MTHALNGASLVNILAHQAALSSTLTMLRHAGQASVEDFNKRGTDAMQLWADTVGKACGVSLENLSQEDIAALISEGTFLIKHAVRLNRVGGSTDWAGAARTVVYWADQGGISKLVYLSREDASLLSAATRPSKTQGAGSSTVH